MFYLKHWRRLKKIKILRKIFEQSYNIKEDYKVGKYTIPFFFYDGRIAVYFGEYNSSENKVIELEKSGVKIFNIPDNEDIFQTVGRLLYVVRYS